jgi:hypothetical protein
VQQRDANAAPSDRGTASRRRRDRVTTFDNVTLRIAEVGISVHQVLSRCDDCDAIGSHCE